ncbi:helix-hairpin-helix domain-containing protein [Paenarthrobacter aurescens]|uniref:DNA-binding protein n=1 Tax=Paenarthrobacter aurescens TaxID=43663 RepID=A0A4Y3NK29_PAEAU|nr:helix-hairpin-helix domain-containing protein [Paenarthrobacter aurescens]MDO6143690.1 helix-hairpin-helix domain-containing protein [Paenarthrobacter aurescens]MDO6147538.1 helix-hairpin-helix domain-containing protein [Paenarthrobacter aurescens]MDO6158781.1 helix-hairpin-helix domain-containing protein [Paenarthrobacter aurescens]MDO6162765.1 helix-hairpin-helix domain-containing protein [Paenarthrobacter aurescens]GEB19341.1 DNA-binding protein [Paenarthrobacter aurescens]
MPRRNRDASPDAATQAARQRFASRLGSEPQTLPLLQLSHEPEPDFDESDPETPLYAETSLYARTRWRSPWRVAALLAVLGIGIIGWHLWQSAIGQPRTEPLSPSLSSSPALPEPLESPRTEATGVAGILLVHVAGAVQKPGIVSLPQGSRVFQAIDAAGGAVANAELDALNLAELLTDGAKIQVPRVGEVPPPASTPLSGSSGSAGGGSSAGGLSGPAASGAKVNINTATLEELGTLPRVGPVTAQGIIDWRKEHGPFASVDELDAVDGIGPKLMESLKDLVTVQGG